MPGEPSRRRSGRSHEAFGDGRPRGMAITAQGMAPRAGQNPAYTPSGPAAVDLSANEIGISALCRGQPCGWRILSLLNEIDPLAWPCVVNAQGFAVVPGSKGLKGCTRNGVPHAQGEGAGDPRDRPFLFGLAPGII